MKGILTKNDSRTELPLLSWAQQSSSKKCVICPKWTSHGQTKHNAVELSDSRYSKPNSTVLNEDGLHHRFLERMASVGCSWIYPVRERQWVLEWVPVGPSGAKPKLASPKTSAAPDLNLIYGVWMGMGISHHFTKYPLVN